MNFNISNSNNFVPFSTSKNPNKFTEGQLWFLGTVLLKNSLFNSFETIFVSLLIAMESPAKSSKTIEFQSCPTWSCFGQ
jgi:hypothetical protein